MASIRLQKPDRTYQVIEFTSTAEIIQANVTSVRILESATFGDNCTIDEDGLIHENSSLGDNTYLAFKTIVGRNVEIGMGCSIGQGVVFKGNNVIGDNVVIANGCHIDSSVDIGNNTAIGEDCKIYSNCVLGTGIVIADDSLIGSVNTIGNDVVMLKKTHIEPELATAIDVYIGYTSNGGHFVNYAGNSKVAIDCVVKTIAEWEALPLEVMEEYAVSIEERDEYLGIINQIEADIVSESIGY